MPFSRNQAQKNQATKSPRSYKKWDLELRSNKVRFNPLSLATKPNNNKMSSGAKQDIRRYVIEFILRVWESLQERDSSIKFSIFIDCTYV